MAAVSLIKSNLKHIQDRIQAALYASVPHPVRLVAVSKTKPNSDILDAYESGHRHFGENYIQELVEKVAQLPTDIQWHFIGALQTNKLKSIALIPNLYLVETIDSAKKAIALNKLCAGRLEPLGILLQVNTSTEESKSGIAPDSVVDVARTVVETCPFLVLRGLMTIGSSEHSSLVPNPDFETLKGCKSEIEGALGLKGLELSMGMSDDFETAVAQGSTNVRVGSSIFGQRKKAV